MSAGNSVTPRILERPEHPISRRDIDGNVLKVLYRLVGAGHTAYIVGGGVRDLMLGRRPKDFDIATSADPQEVRDLFRNSRLIGRRFRLVHVFFGQQNIEVATFRKRGEDPVGDGDPMIRLDNTFGTPEEDAFRRDFTVNALFYDIRTFRVIDYVGGVDDLERRIIRSIGDPDVRMREDPVRMIRAARMSARFDLTIDPDTEAAIIRCRDDLAKASTARLAEETFRTLGMNGAARAFNLMHRLGRLPVMLPYIGDHLDRAEAAENIERNMAAVERELAPGGVADRAIVLAALFLDHYVNDRDLRDPATIRDLLTALRGRGFARADTERMRLILEAWPHLIEPNRRTFRLARRSFFAEARAFYELLASNYGAEPAALTRYLEGPTQRVRQPDSAPSPRRRRRRNRRRRPAAASTAASPATSMAASPAASMAASPATSRATSTDGVAGSSETRPDLTHPE